MELLSTSAAQSGGCFIVDATRQGKRFPDSFSKTIPIWACVLNRAVYQHRQAMSNSGVKLEEYLGNQPVCSDHFMNAETGTWDCSLHLPLWVSDTEREKIEKQIDNWVSILFAANADIGSLSKALKKPLQPLWMSQNTVVWLNEIPDAASWSFTPIISVSASQPLPRAQRVSDGGSGWNYIPGAADDEESWARGLTPALFWKHAHNLLNGSAEECNRMVAEIVERERVSRAYRGLEANQIRVRASKNGDDCRDAQHKRKLSGEAEGNKAMEEAQARKTPASGIYWIGETNLAVGSSSCGQSAEISELVDCVIDCGIEASLHCTKSYLLLPIMDSKHDRFSLQKNLSQAVAFAEENIVQRRSLLIICATGEDLSVCVCLTILLALFNAEGAFDAGSHFGEIAISKWDVRQRLVYLCNFVTNARPSRRNLRQVFQFLLNLKNSMTRSLGSPDIDSLKAITEGEE